MTSVGYSIEECFIPSLLHELSLYLAVENTHKWFVALSFFALLNLWTVFTN